MRLQISNLNIQELLIHFSIVLSLLFNRPIKPNIRFLTITSKLLILLTTYIVLALLLMVISVYDDKHC